MDIRGLLLVNSENVGDGDQSPASALTGIVDVVGKTPLQRMVERLQQYGISSISAVVESALSSSVRDGLPKDIACVSVAHDRFWRTAESEFNDMAQNGAELVVLIRLGAYAEIDFEKLIQYHLDRQGRVTDRKSVV